MDQRYLPTWNSLRTHPTPQYEYHLKTYGDPAKFGYKDFIPLFLAEKFDPDEWAECFSRAASIP